MELGEEVSESKKVNDFMAGIKADARLEAAKAVVTSNPKMLNDFNATQTYLQNFVDTTESQSKRVRFASAVETNKGGHRNNNKGKSVKGNSKPKVAARSYSNEEWKKLSEDERAKVRQLREQKKNNKRKASGVASGDDSDEGNDGDDPTPNAGQQFGRNGHKKKKNGE